MIPLTDARRELPRTPLPRTPVNKGKEEGQGLLDAPALRLILSSGRGARHATLVDDERTAIVALELAVLDPIDQRCLERGMGASPGGGALPHQHVARALYLHQHLLRHLLRRERRQSLIESIIDGTPGPWSGLPGERPCWQDPVVETLH